MYDVEIAVGYQDGHWESVWVETEIGNFELLEEQLYDLIPDHIKNRTDVSFLHAMYVEESDEAESS